jgi:sec-independent protein translocase protein TatC
MVDEKKLPFTEHLGELRNRLIICVAALVLGMIPGWFISGPVQDFLQAPLNAVLPEGSRVVNLTLTEGFGNRMRIALMAGLLFSLPVIIYQVWRFVAPGLYAHERRMIIPFVVAFSFFFFAGAAFGYRFIFPTTLAFFVKFSGGEVPALISQASYQSFAFWMFVAFGAIFETPLAIILLARFGIVNPRTLAKRRKYAFLVAFVAAAVLTPSPDVFTQSMLALPMYLLFELGLMGARIFGRKPAAERTEEAAPQAT